jgi:hypothetical protein
MDFPQRLFPDWNISLSRAFQEKWDSLIDQIVREIHLGTWTPHPLFRIVTPDDELKKLEIFGNKIDRLIAEGKDSYWSLPKHPDREFDNVFFYNKPPWCSYFLRQPLTRRALAVLLVHKSVDMKELRVALFIASVVGTLAWGFGDVIASWSCRCN